MTQQTRDPYMRFTEILQLVTEAPGEFRQADIARQLGITDNTVRTYLKTEPYATSFRIHEKFGVVFPTGKRHPDLPPTAEEFSVGSIPSSELIIGLQAILTGHSLSKDDLVILARTGSVLLRRAEIMGPDFESFRITQAATTASTKTAAKVEAKNPLLTLFADDPVMLDWTAKAVSRASTDPIESFTDSFEFDPIEIRPVDVEDLFYRLITAAVIYSRKAFPKEIYKKWGALIKEYLPTLVNGSETEKLEAVTKWMTTYQQTKN